MHYIIGSTFTVGSPKPRGPQPVGSVQPRRKSAGPFTGGEVYTVYNIQSESGKLKYTFVDSGMNPIDHIFESFKEADGYIAKVAGVQLPDYESFYRNSNA